MLRQIVVADTEAEARRIGEPANKHHHANITWLMRLHRDSGLVTRLNVPLAGTYEDARKDGTLIAGTPDMVREEIETVVGDGETLLRVFEELGLHVWFRYQKYREEFAYEDVIAAVRQLGGQAPSRSLGGPGVATERDDWGPIRREQMSRMRRTIAANMVRSVSTIPHLTNFDDADVTEMERLRKASADDHAKANVKLTALS